jgi:hypothetical protein
MPPFVFRCRLALALALAVFVTSNEPVRPTPFEATSL